jgi:hypothetical protein
VVDTEDDGPSVPLEHEASARRTVQVFPTRIGHHHSAVVGDIKGNCGVGHDAAARRA